MLRRPRMLALVCVLVATVAVVAASCGNGDADGVELVDTTWLLDQEASTLEATAPQVRVTARFDGERLSGSGGCNNYSAPYTLDGSKMSFGSVASTRIGCAPPASNVEVAYFERLPQVRSYAVTGRTLTLTTSTEGADLVYRARP